MIKYYKFGFGRATDYVNEEIRLGRMTRDEGIAVVERYDGCCGPDYISSFCEYIGIVFSSFGIKCMPISTLTCLSWGRMAQLLAVFRWG